MATSGSRREGFALVLVLLALMLVTAIASAALVAAVGQLRATTIEGRVLSERKAAVAAVDGVLGTARGFPAAQVGDSAVEMLWRPFGRHGWQRVLDLRVSREAHLFWGEAVLDSGVPMRDMRLVWWMDPEVRIAAHRGVLEAGTIVIQVAARVVADSILTGRPGIPACDGFPLLTAAFTAQPMQVAAEVPPPPEWGPGRNGSDFAGVRLGWFSRLVLQRLADHRVTAGGSPPTVGCTGCWSGLVFSNGSTEVTQQGAGVLVVNGDLTFAPGSSWTGLVLASGDVIARGTARIQGLVRSGGSVTLEPGSFVDGSACAAFRALLATDSLARPIPLPGRSRLAPLGPGVG